MQGDDTPESENQQVSPRFRAINIPGPNGQPKKIWAQLNIADTPVYNISRPGPINIQIIQEPEPPKTKDFLTAEEIQEDQRRFEERRKREIAEEKARLEQQVSDAVLRQANLALANAIRESGGEQKPESLFDRQLREAKEQAPVRRILSGHSLIYYDEQDVDESHNILGYRWLETGQGGMIVAPSGHGKSSGTIQMAIGWSYGQSVFAIKPPRPLKILVLQSEDNRNDMIVMARMVRRMGLTPEQRAVVDANTRIEWIYDLSGAKFVACVDELLDQFAADLVIINPLTGFLGCSVRDEDKVNDFLRLQLSPVLIRRKAACLIVNHWPKTNFQKTDDYSWFDWMYVQAGCASLTNWPRAVLVIAPCEIPGTYRFIAGKRFDEIGWESREYWFAHSVEDDIMLWVPANHEQIVSAKKTKALEPVDVLRHIPKIDAVSQEKYFQLCKPIGEKKARRFVNILIEDGKVYQWDLPRDGTRPSVGYSQSKPQE